MKCLSGDLMGHLCVLGSGTKLMQMDKKFSVRAGCRSQVYESRVLCAFAMDMVILAPFSLKVCFVVRVSSD